LELEPTSDGIVYGQDVFFLGFPYGMRVELGNLNRGFPLPFVKKAILSCIHTTENGVQIYYLDGHNNPGFSGGPVVFKEANRQNFKVASVISGYRQEEEPIYQAGQEIHFQEIPLVYRYNTGIIYSYGIKHAVDLIKGNPIGYKLRA
ncbi:MAG TPA: hypothetical protein VE439_06450, partial [Anaerolineae bacterium]|nr:hypothetical protein [Anaerolineae bacterium]